MARMQPDCCFWALGVPYPHGDRLGLDLCRQGLGFRVSWTRAFKTQCLMSHPDKNPDDAKAGDEQTRLNVLREVCAWMLVVIKGFL